MKLCHHHHHLQHHHHFQQHHHHLQHHHHSHSQLVSVDVPTRGNLVDHLASETGWLDAVHADAFFLQRYTCTCNMIERCLGGNICPPQRQKQAKILMQKREADMHGCIHAALLTRFFRISETGCIHGTRSVGMPANINLFIEPAMLDTMVIVFLPSARRRAWMPCFMPVNTPMTLTSNCFCTLDWSRVVVNVIS